LLIFLFYLFSFRALLLILLINSSSLLKFSESYHDDDEFESGSGKPHSFNFPTIRTVSNNEDLQTNDEILKKKIQNIEQTLQNFQMLSNTSFQELQKSINIIVSSKTDSQIVWKMIFLIVTAISGFFNILITLYYLLP